LEPFALDILLLGDVALQVLALNIAGEIRDVETGLVSGGDLSSKMRSSNVKVFSSFNAYSSRCWLSDVSIAHFISDKISSRSINTETWRDGTS
jgi:hypothetical protein